MQSIDACLLRVSCLSLPHCVFPNWTFSVGQWLSWRSLRQVQSCLSTLYLLKGRLFYSSPFHRTVYGSSPSILLSGNCMQTHFLLHWILETRFVATPHRTSTPFICRIWHFSRKAAIRCVLHIIPLSSSRYTRSHISCFSHSVEDLSILLPFHRSAPLPREAVFDQVLKKRQKERSRTLSFVLYV